MKLACVFPGQGSQSIGMMGELSEHYSVVADTFKQASDALAYDLWKIVTDGPAGELNKTEITQPAMLTAGVAAWKILQQKSIPSVDVMAGHSLGEYTALVCAGALGFEDAVKLVAERGRLMQSAVPAGVGAMAAILGLDDDTVKSVCEQASGNDLIVQAVNFNSPGQVVIAGHNDAVEKAMELAKEAKAKRALKLPVSVPSHSALMEGAAAQLGEVLAGIEVKTPSIPVIQNVDAQIHTDPAEIKLLLQQQLHKPVLWVDTVEQIMGRGVTDIVEAGPGKVLAGLNKRINKAATNYTVDNVANLDKFLTGVIK